MTTTPALRSLAPAAAGLLLVAWATSAGAWSLSSETCFQGAEQPAETQRACTEALASSDVSDIERSRLLYRRGLMAIEIEDYRAAADDFDDALHLKPDNEAEILAARAAAHRYLERSEEAIADYMRSIQLDEDEISTYRSLASLLQSLDRHREAVFTLTQALDHDTENAYIYRDRGRLHIEMGQYQDAIADLNRAILIKRDYLGPWRDRAVVYERQGRVVEAIEEYQKVLARKPGDRLAKRALARLEIAEPTPEPDPKPEPAQRTVDPRVALVIGNGAYRGRLISELPNPTNDATDIGASFERTGFDVTVALDVSQSDFEAQIDAFGEALEPDTVGLFYYAGHAVQIDGRNYLVPIDVDESTVVSEATDMSVIEANFVSLESVLGAMAAAANHTNILILDACRDNPFGDHLKDGLAQSRYQPPDIYIAFSTAPNTVSVDGLGRNSPFTKALLAELEQDGVQIETIFKRVRGIVVEATQKLVDADQLGKPQVPWSVSSLTRDFYFRPST